MRTLVAFLVGGAIVWWLFTREPDDWLATAYPSSSDLTEWVHLGRYETLDDCRYAARSYLSNIGRSTEGTYECGLNCETFAERYDSTSPDAYEMHICEETLY